MTNIPCLRLREPERIKSVDNDYVNYKDIVDTFLKKRKFGLFDKFWYLKRAENFDNMVYRGVHVEDEKVVELDFKHFFKGKD